MLALQQTCIPHTCNLSLCHLQAIIHIYNIKQYSLNTLKYEFKLTCSAKILLQIHQTKTKSFNSPNTSDGLRSSSKTPPLLVSYVAKPPSLLAILNNCRNKQHQIRTLWAKRKNHVCKQMTYIRGAQPLLIKETYVNID